MPRVNAEATNSPLSPAPIEGDKTEMYRRIEIRIRSSLK